MLRSTIRVVHVVALATWLGSGFFFSFVTALSVFGYFSKAQRDPSLGLTGLTQEVGRRMAGGVVGEILPKYFALQALCGALALGTAVASTVGGPRMERVRRGLLLVALGLVLVHWRFVFPHTAWLGDERWQAERSGAVQRAAELKAQFGAWHGVSSSLNLLTVLWVLGVLGWTAARLGAPPADSSNGPPA